MRQLPSFVFQTTLVLGREDRGGKSWEERASMVLQGVAETKGGECFILAKTDASDRLRLTLYSQPDWLKSAADRLSTYAASNSAPFLTNLIGLGRAARGLHVVEPQAGTLPRYDAVTDVREFLDLFASPDATGVESTEGGLLTRRVRWFGVPPRSAPVDFRQLETSRSLFRAHCSFEDLETMVDFLRDFRQGTATAIAKPEPRRPPPSESGLDDVSVRDRRTPAPSVARSLASVPSAGRSVAAGRSEVRSRSRSKPRRKMRRQSPIRSSPSPAAASGVGQSKSRPRGDGCGAGGRKKRRAASASPQTRRSPSYSRVP